MRNRHIFTSSFLFVIIITVFAYWWYTLIFSSTEEFRVVFLDVGQGDSILIETPNNRQVLIDAGRGVRVLQELGKALKPNDKRIDVIVMTHADADHIGGFNAVLDRYKVGEVFLAHPEAKTQTYTRLREKIDEENYDINFVNSPETFDLDGVTFYLIWPFVDGIKDPNSASIVLIAKYKDAEVLLTGDAPMSVEDRLSETFADLLKDIDLLKAGHHGSKTSTGQKLLDITKPKHVVISAGENNSYGHPDPSVLERIKASNQEIKIYETKDGQIEFLSNGGDLYLNN